jgi:DNA-binding transcriptional ArsR family regulator
VNQGCYTHGKLSRQWVAGASAAGPAFKAAFLEIEDYVKLLNREQQLIRYGLELLDDKKSILLLRYKTSMNNPFPFRAAKSRPTKQQEQERVINEQIINYMKTLQGYKNAETLWLGMSDQGYKMSISSFNTRLKKLVEAGLIEKRSVGYNKHFYKITD